jgi:uncharacterized protein YjfI (DUF2170 family)
VSVLVKVSRTQHNIYGALAHKKSLVSVLVKVSRIQHNIYGALAHKKSLVSVLVKVSNTIYTAHKKSLVITKG